MMQSLNQSRDDMVHCLRGTLLSLALVTWFVPASACDSQAMGVAPRGTVVLFDYSGAEQGEARNRYSLFKGVLRDKMAVWFEELGDLRRVAPFLGELKLHPRGNASLPDTLAGPGDVEEYWRRNPALELLRGGVISQNGTFSVQSRIYLGDFKGGLEPASVSVRLPIVSSEFANASDSHSLVTYYALAMQAKSLHCSSGIIVGLLNKAREKAVDLARRKMADPEIERVSRAIDVELRAATRGANP